MWQLLDCVGRATCLHSTFALFVLYKGCSSPRCASLYGFVYQTLKKHYHGKKYPKNKENQKCNTRDQFIQRYLGKKFVCISETKTSQKIVYLILITYNIISFFRIGNKIS